jgi:outer membrane receptor protein involved in Fe transport
MAAAAMQPADTLQLPAFTITAIKQAPTLAVQPVAATVIDASDAERNHVVTMRSASVLVPNFFIPDYGSRMTSTIYVRGFGTRIDQPSVGLNVDNVAVLNKNDFDFDLFDIERIEVMRGPQSTLYGRNTMAGVVNVYTLSPMKYQGLRLMTQYSTGNSWRVGAGYYHKLRDDLAMSFSLNGSGTDGFFTNAYNGLSADAQKEAAARWKTIYQPSTDLSIENVAAFNYSRQTGYPYKYLETQQVSYNDTCSYRRTSLSDGLTVQWHSGGVQFSSITGLRYLDDLMQLDQDFTPKSYFTLGQATREWSVTQDLVARGSVGAKYSWLGGLFGFYKHDRVEAPVTFLADGIAELVEKPRNTAIPSMPIRWQTDNFLLGSNFTLPVWGAALYHQSELKLGRWTLTQALRLDYEHTAITYCNTTSTAYDVVNAADGSVINSLPIDINDRGHLSKSLWQLLPKLTVCYRLPMPSASSVYASVGKGYKSGGYNTQMFSDVLQQRLMQEMGMVMKYDIDDIIGYKPEYSWNYEVGAHVACADGRINTDLDVFYIDCRDQQLTVFPPDLTTGRIMTNAGRTRSWGVEAAIAVRPYERVNFNLSYGFTDARFVRFSDSRGDYSGKYLPYAPRHTLFCSLTYRQPLPRDLWLSFTVDSRAVGPIYWDESNTHRQNLYALLGGSIRLDYDQRYSLEFWGQNILNARFDTFYFVSISHAFAQQGKPRQLGVTLRINI